MVDPIVDVVIAVHSSTRPIARAAGSVLDGTDQPIRVTVVAHNIDPAIIRENLGSYAEDPRLRLLELQDGIPSPAGPMNLGFDHAEAPFVSLLGSDDEFEKGLIGSWLALQQETGADVVLAKIQEVQGVIDPYPPVRFGRRTRKLDPCKDRLMYRSAPLGLVSRERFPDLRFSAGLGSGEDLIYTLTLWFNSTAIAYDLQGPRYIGHGDAPDRVTGVSRPLADDFAFLDELESLHWFRALAHGKRLAVAVKMLRIHLFDALAARLDFWQDNEPLRQEFVALIQRLESLCPGSEKLLSRIDRKILDAVRRPSTNREMLETLLSKRSSYRSAGVLLTRNPFLALHRQAPLRTLGAGFMVIQDNR